MGVFVCVPVIAGVSVYVPKRVSVCVLWERRKNERPRGLTSPHASLCMHTCVPVSVPVPVCV
jgi:hypothetical protein